MPFSVCSGQLFELFSIILAILVIHPKGCDEATPIFSLQIFVGRWANIHAWFLLYRVGDDLSQFCKNFRAYQITIKGVAGPRPFSLFIVGAIKMFNISWFLLHQVNNHPTYIWNILITYIGLPSRENNCKVLKINTQSFNIICDRLQIFVY